MIMNFRMYIFKVVLKPGVTWDIDNFDQLESCRRKNRKKAKSKKNTTVVITTNLENLPD